MTPLPTPAQADAVAASAVKLNRAVEVIDPGLLSELLQRPVNITHARIKPGHSVVVAHASQDGEHGWTMLTNDRDKFCKAQQRAESFGQQLQIHQDDDAAGYLYSGSLWSDPALAKQLHDARSTLNEIEDRQVRWEILRYNPRRRLVAVVDAGHSPKVVRVAAGGADRVLATAARWRSLGLPVTNVAPLGHRQSATIAPLWGAGDLAQQPYEPAAQTAGEAVARLHNAPRDQSCGDRRYADPAEAAAALSRIAPWLEDRAEQLALRCTAQLKPTLGSTTAEIHGDLSPDQIILAAEGSHKVRIIDLDRTGCGHPMRDIGSWVATCRHAGTSELIDAFLAGYATDARLDPTDLDAWEAYAHLARATDFFRHREPDWPQHTIRALNLAEEALNR
ncbi:phosphotransferase [Nesterenkonia ebinurensis]|uniref:phosphotransferase n=1 Tax=Nesterenkonia ebinurensis TaxID=2608252 RepID=UPI00123CB003|nr:phosphotransferase [Nesterenkonia ebinurensis]